MSATDRVYGEMRRAVSNLHVDRETVKCARCLFSSEGSFRFWISLKSSLKKRILIYSSLTMVSHLAACDLAVFNTSMRVL